MSQIFPNTKAPCRPSSVKQITQVPVPSFAVTQTLIQLSFVRLMQNDVVCFFPLGPSRPICILAKPTPYLGLTTLRSVFRSDFRGCVSDSDSSGSCTLLSQSRSCAILTSIL